MKVTKKIAAVFALALASTLANASGGGYPLDRFPAEKLANPAALQDGAKLFLTYCTACHGASSMRFNRLRDIGFTEGQIRDTLLPPDTKPGDTIRTAMTPVQARAAFGALPPDLSVIARARASESGSGPDWLYTYLRAYYRDATRPSGWNNAVFPSVGMPHVLAGLQGARGATIIDTRVIRGEKGEAAGLARTTVSFDADGARSERTDKLDAGQGREGREIVLGKAQGGTQDAAAYDENVGNIVAFLAYLSDPSAQERKRLGVWVLLFLAAFTVFAWWLNREYWKDIR